jgi:hypothetical protein
MEAAIHSLREWRKETMACLEKTKARLECKKPRKFSLWAAVQYDYPTSDYIYNSRKI